MSAASPEAGARARVKNARVRRIAWSGVERAITLGCGLVFLAGVVQAFTAANADIGLALTAAAVGGTFALMRRHQRNRKTRKAGPI
jgi:hypothetical protein